MQAQASQPVRTFSIGFAEGAYNEAEDARKVAAHLGTAHTELYVDARTALDVIPKLPRMYDEPFADSSQMPTHLVAQLARQHVTVALSGDAGDELFGGYNRHVWGSALNARLGRLPAPLRKALGGLLGAIAPEPAGTIANALQPLLPAQVQGAPCRRPGRQDRAALRRRPPSIRCIARCVRSTPIRRRPCSAARRRASWAAGEMARLAVPIDPLDRMTLADSLSYLTDDILQKVDRAAMAVALETRVPFLDKDVVEFAARVPPSMKVRDGARQMAGAAGARPSCAARADRSSEDRLLAFRSTTGCAAR